MSISKDVIKQCLISKQREVDEAVIVNRPTGGMGDMSGVFSAFPIHITRAKEHSTRANRAAL